MLCQTKLCLSVRMDNNGSMSDLRLVRTSAGFGGSVIQKNILYSIAGGRIFHIRNMPREMFSGDLFLFRKAGNKLPQFQAPTSGGERG